MKSKFYFYYFKQDSKKESIDKIAATNYDEALEYFAARKQMSKHVFLNLFEIDEIKSK